jgi:hypothetical protein
MKNQFSGYLVTVLGLVVVAVIAFTSSGRSISNSDDNPIESASGTVAPNTSTSTTTKTTTTSTSTTTTRAPTTTSLKRELDVAVTCFNTESKNTSATISVSVVNPTSEIYGFNVIIKPGYEENFYIGSVEKGIQKMMTLEYEYDPQESSNSGKNYFTAKIYSIFTLDSFTGETDENLVGQCNFDRNYKDGQTSPNLTQPSTTTTTLAPTTTTTTLAPTTTTTTLAASSYNKSTHILLTLTGLEDNPYLCEIPGTGVIERYSLSYWGRCAEYTESIPNYDNIFIPAWYNGESYTTKDPNWCYYDGEIIGCNVLRRIKANQDINKTRDLIIKSIENLNNLDSKDGNSISSGYLSGCKVYRTTNKLEADYIVGITNSLNADYRVSVIGESLGTGSCGTWYIQNSTIGADFTIAYIDRSLNPSLVVDFVSSKLELP